MISRIFKLGFFYFLISFNPLYSSDLSVIAIEYPPYTSAALPGNGLSFEIMREIFKETDINLVPVFLPPARCDWEFTREHYSVTLYNNLSFSEVEHFKQILIQRVIFTFFYNRDFHSIEWEELNDLAGYSIGILRSVESDYFKKIFVGAGMSIVEVSSLEQTFQLLKKGRIDLVVSVDLTALEIISRLFPGDTSIVQTDKRFMTIDGGPWFNISMEEGRDAYMAYERGKQRIIESGRIFHLFEKYYGVAKVPDFVLIE